MKKIVVLLFALVFSISVYSQSNATVVVKDVSTNFTRSYPPGTIIWLQGAGLQYLLKVHVSNNLNLAWVLGSTSRYENLNMSSAVSAYNAQLWQGNDTNWAYATFLTAESDPGYRADTANIAYLNQKNIFARLQVFQKTVFVGTDTAYRPSKLCVYSHDSTAISGDGISSAGVAGRSISAGGVLGSSISGNGVSGTSTSGVGVYGYSIDSIAGYFNGNTFTKDTSYFTDQVHGIWYVADTGFKLNAPVISDYNLQTIQDTAGIGSSENVGVQIFQANTDKQYGLISGTPPSWKQMAFVGSEYHNFFGYYSGVGVTRSFSSPDTYYPLVVALTSVNQDGFILDDDSTQAYCLFSNGKVKIDCYVTLTGGAGDHIELQVYETHAGAEVPVTQIAEIATGGTCTVGLTAYDNSSSNLAQYQVRMKNVSAANTVTITRLSFSATALNY